MSKAPYTFAVLSDANLTMYPSFVKPTTVGPRVTSAADLTVGKWYAMFTNACDKPTVIHAQYKGGNPAGYHEFAVCEDDYQAMPALAHEISRRTRTFITGLGEGGDILHVYKFKSRKEKPVKPVSKSPYTTSSTCWKHGIKEGDKFVVVNGGNRNFKEGTIVTLTHDDDSNCPYFEVPGRQGREACYLWRLAPVTATGRFSASSPNLQNVPKAPAPVLGPIDQIKSEIDALRAKVTQKCDQIAQLSEEIAGINVAINDARDKLKASLDGYI